MSQPTRRWNEKNRITRFWDPGVGESSGTTTIPSDLEIIRSPEGWSFDQILKSLCQVVSELVELEEARAAQSAELEQED